MQPAQEILLRLPNKRLPPLFTNILQHLQRIIVTIPLPGFHNIILGRQKPTSSPISRRTASKAVSPGSIPPWGNCQAPFCPERSQINNFPSCRTIIPATFGRYNLSMPCSLTYPFPHFQPCSFHKPVENGQKILSQISPPTSRHSEYQPPSTRRISGIKNEKLPVCGGNSGQSAKNFSNQILTYCHFSNIVLYWQVYCSCKVKYGNRPSFYFSRVSLIKLRS